MSISRTGILLWSCSIAFIMLWAFSLGGCGHLVDTDSDTQRSGRYVPESVFSQIKSGQTTVDWLKDNLGEPSERCKQEDGSELWKWSYTERKQSHGEIFIIFKGSDTKEIIHSLIVEVKDDVVTGKWRG
ncbi:MAG: hypothetical protein ACM359_13910 [Bacillota bacterium]